MYRCICIGCSNLRPEVQGTFTPSPVVECPLCGVRSLEHRVRTLGVCFEGRKPSCVLEGWRALRGARPYANLLRAWGTPRSGQSPQQARRAPVTQQEDRRRRGPWDGAAAPGVPAGPSDGLGVRRSPGLCSWAPGSGPGRPSPSRLRARPSRWRICGCRGGSGNGPARG